MRRLCLEENVHQELSDRGKKGLVREGSKGTINVEKFHFYARHCLYTLVVLISFPSCYYFALCIWFHLIPGVDDTIQRRLIHSLGRAPGSAVQAYAESFWPGAVTKTFLFFSTYCLQVEFYVCVCVCNVVHYSLLK